jgi:hypothetical protein
MIESIELIIIQEVYTPYMYAVYRYCSGSDDALAAGGPIAAGRQSAHDIESECRLHQSSTPSYPPQRKLPSRSCIIKTTPLITAPETASAAADLPILLLSFTSVPVSPSTPR